LVLFFKKELLPFLNLLFVTVMAFVSSNYRSRMTQFFGSIAVVFAIAAQICAGALTAPDRSTTPQAALNAAMVLCLGGYHPSKDGSPPIRRHMPDLAIAAEFHHFVQHAAIIDNDGALPPPPPSLAFWSGVPAARRPVSPPLPTPPAHLPPDLSAECRPASRQSRLAARDPFKTDWVPDALENSGRSAAMRRRHSPPISRLRTRRVRQPRLSRHPDVG